MTAAPRRLRVVQELRYRKLWGLPGLTTLFASVGNCRVSLASLDYLLQLETRVSLALLHYLLPLETVGFPWLHWTICFSWKLWGLPGLTTLFASVGNCRVSLASLDYLLQLETVGSPWPYYTICFRWKL